MNAPMRTPPDAPPFAPAVAPPPAAPASVHPVAVMQAGGAVSPSSAVVPYVKCGADRQYLAFDMLPGDTVFAEVSALVDAGDGLRISAAIAGDADGDAEGPLGAVLDLLAAPFRVARAAVGRVASGERLWMQTLRAEAPTDLVVGNPRGGQIGRVALERGASVMLARGAWIAHTGAVRLGLATSGRLLTSLIVDAPYLWQRASGDGDVFFAARGHVVERMLAEGERRLVDPHAVLGWSGPLAWKAGLLGSVRGMVFAGEGAALLAVTGPGRLWLDTAAASRQGASRRADRRRRRPDPRDPLPAPEPA